MQLSIDIDTSAFANQLEAAMGDLITKTLVTMAEAQIANIKRRASLGIGLNDAPMPEYSPMTKKLRSAKGLSVDARTLSDSGQMLRSLRPGPIERQGNSYSISLEFQNSAAKKKAAQNQQRALFFGVSPNDAQRLRALWEQS